MDPEELFKRFGQMLDAKFEAEREVTRKIVQEEARSIVKEEIEPIKKNIMLIDKRLKKLTKLVNVIVRLFDQEDMNLKKRVSNIEEYLGISDPTRLV